jgi:3-deoxy-D-manno-octulosonic-acid transferase
MFLLYNLLLTLFAPLWVPWMLWRTLRRKEKPAWRERFGDYSIRPGKDRNRIWIHAVSVGEVMAAIPILREIRRRMKGWEIVLTVTTTSGHQTARERAEGLFDHLFYFPLDVARFQLRAMERVRPKIVAVMETELWFNFLWCAKALGAKTALVNGRISDRSFPRSMRIRFFYRSLLGMVDLCLMQTERDAERIRALGATRVEVVGNSKFDEAAEGLDADPMIWRKELGLPDGLPVVVVGSTRGEDEERFVLEAIASVGLDRLAVVHAPRHLERATELRRMAGERFGEASLRSQGGGGRYVILDTYGELAQVYCLADVAIVGGGFGDYGGQNLIQPLAHGKPVLHGPHFQNFSEVAEAADAAGAGRSCKTPAELAAALSILLENESLRDSMSEAARALARAGAGAGARYVERLVHLKDDDQGA